MCPIMRLSAACPTSPNASAPKSGAKNARETPAMNRSGSRAKDDAGTSGNKPYASPRISEAPANSVRRWQTRSVIIPAGVCIKNTPSPAHEIASPIGTSDHFCSFK